MTATKPVALFGVGCTSLSQFTTAYREWLDKRNRRRRVAVPRPTMHYIAAFKTTIRTADVYLVETVAVFVRIRHLLPPSAAVVVSDSPLLLSEIPCLRPLDWLKDAWHFKLHPVDFAAFETGRASAAKIVDHSIWEGAAPITLDRLGLVIDETASGTLLTPINAVQFQLNFVDRVHFRQALARYLAGKTELKAFEATARSLISQGQTEAVLSLRELTRVVTMLKTQGKLYRDAIALMLDKKSANKVLKDSNVTPFEIKYLARLVTANIPATKEVAT